MIEKIVLEDDELVLAAFFENCIKQKLSQLPKFLRPYLELITKVTKEQLQGDALLEYRSEDSSLYLSFAWFKRLGRKFFNVTVHGSSKPWTWGAPPSLKLSFDEKSAWKGVFPERVKRLSELQFMRSLKLKRLGIPEPSAPRWKDARRLKVCRIEANMALLKDTWYNEFALGTPIGWFEVVHRETESIYTILRALGIRSYPRLKEKRRWTKELENELLLLKLSKL